MADYVREVEKFVKLDHVFVQKPAKGVAFDAEKNLVFHDMALDDHLHDPQKLGDALCKLLK